MWGQREEEGQQGSAQAILEQVNERESEKGSGDENERGGQEGQGVGVPATLRGPDDQESVMKNDDREGQGEGFPAGSGEADCRQGTKGESDRRGQNRHEVQKQNAAAIPGAANDLERSQKESDHKS